MAIIRILDPIIKYIIGESIIHSSVTNICTQVRSPAMEFEFFHEQYLINNPMKFLMIVPKNGVYFI